MAFKEHLGTSSHFKGVNTFPQGPSTANVIAVYQVGESQRRIPQMLG